MPFGMMVPDLPLTLSPGKEYDHSTQPWECAKCPALCGIEFTLIHDFADHLACLNDASACARPVPCAASTHELRAGRILHAPVSGLERCFIRYRQPRHARWNIQFGVYAAVTTELHRYFGGRTPSCLNPACNAAGGCAATAYGLGRFPTLR